MRLATPSFSEIFGAEDYGAAVTQMEVLAHSEGFEYVSLGPASTDHIETYQAIPDLLAKSGNVFFGAHLTTPHGEISLPAVQASAEIIQRAASIEDGGFANLRFAALANVPPFVPFFPAAYHQGKAPAFGLALEAADLAVRSFSQAKTLSGARQHLIQHIETHAMKLEETADKLARVYNLAFKGLDFSLAPFPTREISIGYALETLGLPAIGLSGSVAAAAFLMDTLDHANYTRTGFNGLMLPVLEDSSLASRAEEGVLGIKDLLLYATVCGTGLDTIPLPGDASIDQLQAVLLDIAALSLRLDKPLTARLMPIPGRKAGEETGFDFEYFANSKVLSLPAKPLSSKLTGSENFSIQPRKKEQYP